jgi:hypothetical protein
MSIQQPLIRPEYHPRQIVTAADLQAGVDYLAERLRRHNRYLHGCGVTCGLEVQADPNLTDLQFASELQVHVSPGQAVSPQGDAIQVPTAFDQTFTDVLNSPNGGSSRLNLAMLIAVILASGDNLNLYVLLHHTTSGGSPRPMLPEICAPDGLPLANTRITESYEIDLARFLPQACTSAAESTCGDILDELLRYDSMQSGTQLADFMHCPPDTDEQWLVLATVNVTVDASGLPQFQTHYRDRSLLPSSRLLLELLRCFPDAPRIDSAVITRFPNSRWHWVAVTGKGFRPFDRVEIHDPRIPVFTEYANDTSLVFLYYVPPDLPEGKRAFSVVTQFDSIESAKCGVFLDVEQPYFPPYYYPYAYGPNAGSGTIGGGNL